MMPSIVYTVPVIIVTYQRTPAYFIFAISVA
jgi:hypothetical protein